MERQVKAVRYRTINSFLYPACINESFQNNFTPNTLLRIALKNFQASFVMKHPCVTHGSLLYIGKQASLGSLLTCYPRKAWSLGVRIGKSRYGKEDVHLLHDRAVEMPCRERGVPKNSCMPFS